MEHNKVLNEVLNTLHELNDADLDALLQLDSPPPTLPSRLVSQRENRNAASICKDILSTSSIMQYNREPFTSQVTCSQWSGININQSFQLPNISCYDDVDFNLTQLCASQIDQSSNSLIIDSPDIDMIILNETEAQLLAGNNNSATNGNNSNDESHSPESSSKKDKPNSSSLSNSISAPPASNNSFEVEFFKPKEINFEEPLFDLDFDFINELERTYSRMPKTQVQNTNQKTLREPNQAATCPVVIAKQETTMSNTTSFLEHPYNCLRVDYSQSKTDSQSLNHLQFTHDLISNPTSNLDFTLSNSNEPLKNQRAVDAKGKHIAGNDNQSISTITHNDDDNLRTHDGHFEIESCREENSSVVDATLIPNSVVQLHCAVTAQYSDFAFVYALSAQLCQDRVPMDCFVNLKMGLLLSLASIGNNVNVPPIPVVAMGNDSYMTNYLMTHIGDLADRYIGPCADIRLHASGNKRHTWIEADPILLAKGGVFYVGNWSLLRPQRSERLFKIIECSTVTIEKSTYSSPLETAIWTHWRSYKGNAKDQKAFNNFVKIFGIPIIVDDTNHEVLVDLILEQYSVRVFESSVDHLSISADDMREFLAVISKRTVDLSTEASNILQKYFVSARIERSDCLSKQAFAMLKQFSESFAKLAFRHEVLPIDAYAAIFMCENFVQNIFGVNEHPPPKFDAHNYVGTVDKYMKKFQKWVLKYIDRHYNKP